MTAEERLVCRRRQTERLRSREREKRCAPSMSPAHAGNGLRTASTCFSSPRIGSRRSIRRTGRVLRHDPGARRRRRFGGSHGPKGRSGWGQYRDRKIHQIDPETGAISFARSSPKTASSPGSPWVDGEFWHATWEGDESELRRIDPWNGRSPGEARDAARRGYFGTRVRRRRSVFFFLRRRK